MKYLLDIRAMGDLIDMYLEYRDKYGYPHAAARAAAINETTDPDAGYMVRDGDGHELSESGRMSDDEYRVANSEQLRRWVERNEREDNGPARQPRGL